jgi:hypothetical protein
MELNAPVYEPRILSISQSRKFLPGVLVPGTILSAFFVLAVGLQFLAGAYRAELSGYPDEAGHFVSGALVRNYLSSFPPTAVVPFADEFYIHRPKVGIGHWPPVLYLIEGIWFILFHTSRSAGLALMALICAALAASICLVVRRRYGTAAGIAGGLLFVCLAFVQTQTSEVMADMLVALFGFWATLAFADFLSTGATRAMVRFAILALLAIFTKNSGLYLALVPPISILLTGQYGMLRKWSLWLGAVAVGLPTVVWILLTRQLIPARVGEGPASQLFMQASRLDLYFLYVILGPCLLALAVAGIVRELIISRSTDDRLSPTLVSAILSVLLFESVAAVQEISAVGVEPRYLAPAAAVMIPFVFSGLMWLAGLIGPRAMPKMVRAAALLVLALLVSPRTFAFPHKLYRGFTEVADLIQSDPSLRRGAVLVSSASDGEGLLTSEIVMRYSSSEGFILRASKMLAQSDWNGRGYKSRFDSAEDLFRYLQKLGPNLIVIDDGAEIPAQKHQELLMQMCREHPEYWQSAGTFPIKSQTDVKGDKIYVYRRIGTSDSSDARIHQEMQNVLARMKVSAPSF